MVEDLLRQFAPQVLGSLVRRYGHFDLAEDAVQEALLAAALQWPEQGIPENPRGWLITVAVRRLTDELRSDQARRRREERAAAELPRDTRRAASRPRAGPRRRGRHADAFLSLRSSGPFPGVSARADLARGRRTCDRGDRPRLPRPGRDYRPADQPCQAADQGEPYPLHAPRGVRAGRAADGRAARAVPDLQRGLYGVVRARPAARRTDLGSDPPRPRGASTPSG